MSDISLPWQERLTWIALLSGAFVGAYVYVNRTPFNVPQELPLLHWERSIPLLPWTVWPYTLLTLSNGLMPWLFVRRSTFRRMTMTLALALLVMLAFWTFWPTNYPRPALPSEQAAGAQLYALLTQVDGPGNCFPSAHIGAPAVQLLCLRQDRPRLAGALWLAYVPLGFTVLTTKQHYFWDIPGALLVAGAAYAIGRICWR